MIYTFVFPMTLEEQRILARGLPKALPGDVKGLVAEYYAPQGFFVPTQERTVLQEFKNVLQRNKNALEQESPSLTTALHSDIKALKEMLTKEKDDPKVVKYLKEKIESKQKEMNEIQKNVLALGSQQRFLAHLQEALNSRSPHETTGEPLSFKTCIETARKKSGVEIDTLPRKIKGMLEKLEALDNPVSVRRLQKR